MKLRRIYENGNFVNGLENYFQNLKYNISQSNVYNNYMYLESNFKLNQHFIIDGLFNDTNECIAFSGIFRESFWPEGVFRTHSRLWVADNFRKSAFTPPYEIDEAGPVTRLTAIIEPSFIAKYLIGPMHQEMKLKANAIFISFYGEIEKRSSNITYDVHKYLWNDDLNWFLEKDVLIPPSTLPDRDIFYANISSDFDILKVLCQK